MSSWRKTKVRTKSVGLLLVIWSITGVLTAEQFVMKEQDVRPKLLSAAGEAPFCSKKDFWSIDGVVDLSLGQSLTNEKYEI